MARKAKSAQTEKRTRNWIGIFYEESLPENWKSKLDGLQYALSPWHDRDLNDDGTPKKKHRHVFLKFPNVKSFQQVETIFKELNQPHPLPCQNTVGTIRYFCHLDNPEKAQYDIKDCVDHGVGIAKIIAMSGDKDALEMSYASQICEIIKIHEFLDYDQVFDFCKDQGLDDLALFAFKRRGWVSAYIAGKSYRLNRQVSKERHKELLSAQMKIVDAIKMINKR